MPTNGSQNSIRAINPPLAGSVFQSFRLDGRTVIITGGSRGIDYEVARGLAEARANVRAISPPHRLTKLT
jgi:sorbose reductase